MNHFQKDRTIEILKNHSIHNTIFYKDGVSVIMFAKCDMNQVSYFVEHKETDLSFRIEFPTMPSAITYAYLILSEQKETENV